MGKAPAFQLYASDFYMDTADWTCPQIGVYMRLLMYEWINGGLSPQISDLARIAKVDCRTMHKMWSLKLAKKFQMNGANLLINKRLEEEREKQNKRRELQVEKGISGARKRWESHIAPAIAQAQPDDSSSSSSSSSYIKHKKTYSECFLNFWDFYPIKIGKGQAWKVWQKIEDIPSIEIIIEAIKKQKKWRIDANGEFRPQWKNPTTWLNAKGWEDEITLTEKEDKYADIYRDQ